MGFSSKKQACTFWEHYQNYTNIQSANFLTVWTEAAFRVSVRTECDNGPISRYLRISMLLSLKQESFRWMYNCTTHIIFPSTVKPECSCVMWLWATVSDSAMNKPDCNASSLWDPRVGLEWISSAVTNYFFHRHSFFSFFILLLSFIAKACNNFHLFFLLNRCCNRLTDTHFFRLCTLKNCF